MCAGNLYVITVPIDPEPDALLTQTIAAVCSDVPFVVDPQTYVTNVPATFTWIAAYPGGLSGPASGAGTISTAVTNATTGQLSATFTVTPTGTNGRIP